MNRIYCSLLYWLILAIPCQAQAERHELGRRLRYFENAWEQTADSTLRRQAAEYMNQAVKSFFSLKWAEAGRAMDRGSLLLYSNAAKNSTGTLLALWLKPDKVWVTAGEKELICSLQHFYPLKDGVILPVRFQAKWKSKSAKDQSSIPAGEGESIVPGKICLTLPQQAGDYLLQVQWSDDRNTVEVHHCTVSVSLERDSRLKSLNEFISKSSFTLDHPDKVSLSLNVRQLNRLAKSEILETDYPADQWLKECEQVVEYQNKKQLYYTTGRKGQFWMGVKTPAKGIVPVRIQTVAGDKSKKVPVVLALHGAGGSENLFFDGYGNGKVARLAAEKGWFVVAPRNSFSKPGHDQTLKALAECFPEMDLSQVYVIGHSMGAAEALREVSHSPRAYAAVAALGGGGSPTPAGDNKLEFNRIPFFVGIGEHDFARDKAISLEKTLRQKGVKSVTFKEYQGIEHMIIVQEALPEVFDFFDKVNSAEKNASGAKR